MYLQYAHHLPPPCKTRGFGILQGEVVSSNKRENFHNTHIDNMLHVFAI
jgi:hypothetical protein